MNELTYIYVLIDPLTNIPRYVGKTSYVEKRLKQQNNEVKQYVLISFFYSNFKNLKYIYI